MSQPPEGLIDFARELVALRQGGAEQPERIHHPVSSARLPGVSPARHALDEGGPDELVRWLRSKAQLQLSDCTIGRLQVGPSGGRSRTRDLAHLADQAARLAPELFALQVTCGHAFARALSSAFEGPFDRIEELRSAAPGLPLRAVLSAASGVGTAVVPCEALAASARALVAAGVDIIRVVDPYNDADRLAVAVEAALSSGAVVEGALCISGALHPTKARDSFIDGAVAVASSLERHGVHVVTVQDDLGVLRPVSAYRLFRALRGEVRSPLWAHLTESIGFVIATAISATEAGVAGVDTVLPSVSGVGQAPGIVPLCSSLGDTERRPEVDLISLDELDTHVRAHCHLIGAEALDRHRLPPDPADRGVSADLLVHVLDRIGAASTPDLAMTACEAAWLALGEPAPVPPTRGALEELTVALLERSEPAGLVLDRARADDPQGPLDAVASLREGGFADCAAELVLDSREAILAMVCPDQWRAYEDHVARFGVLEMMGGEAPVYGLEPGGKLDVIVDGRHIEVHAVGSAEEGVTSLEIDGERYDP